MKYPTKIIIATGTFMNITVEVELDTDKIDEYKSTVRALHKHFYGILERQDNVNDVLNQLNSDRSDKINKHKIDYTEDLEPTFGEPIDSTYDPEK